MTDANESRAEELFREVSRLPIEERAPFIDTHCDSEEIRDAVLEKLQTLDGDLGDFFSPPTDRPVFELGEGSQVGPYRLLQKIGEGGFGDVYMAEQGPPVRRKVALKLLKPGMDSREVIARFEAERQALAMMNHPNIAAIFDFGSTDAGHPYFVMELVQGVPITEFCDRNNVTASARLELIVTVCRAIQHAHQKGVIHRDLKPSNILVTLPEDSPVPKIIDFGVAKALSQPLTEKTL
ncbi:MAG: serine/threonine-protein kinase, partial [Myxococcota bacterium]